MGSQPERACWARTGAPVEQMSTSNPVGLTACPIRLLVEATRGSPAADLCRGGQLPALLGPPRGSTGIVLWRRYWQMVLREAERELYAAITRTGLDAAAKKFMRAKAELKRGQAQSSD